MPICEKVIIIREFQKNNPSKTKIENDYGSSKDGCSGIPLAFSGLATRFVHLTKTMLYRFWEHLKAGKALVAKDS